jgi:hypothetical protein
MYGPIPPLTVGFYGVIIKRRDNFPFTMKSYQFLLWLLNLYRERLKKWFMPIEIISFSDHRPVVAALPYEHVQT